MRNVFITAEYNPFHNGHKYHIEKLRELNDCNITAVMSGNFVQRGEPALFDKFTRAKAAVVCGVDLVLELPLPWCLAPAERFCAGSVDIAVASGIVDGFSFGCESGSAEQFTECAKLLNSDTTRDMIKKIRVNMSYPSAVASVVPEKYLDIVKSPNNILGLEYTKELLCSDFKGELLPIKRTCVDHDSELIKDNFCSASHLRGLYRNNRDINIFIPEEAVNIYRACKDSGLYTPDISCYERQIISLLRLLPYESFLSVQDSFGGVGERFYSSVRNFNTINDILMHTKTKRFTLSALRRLVFNTVLQIPNGFYKEKPPYVKVLAFNDNGRILLREMKKKCSIPIIMRKSDSVKLDRFARKIYDLECTATDLYNSFTAKIRKCGTEMTDNIYMEIKK